jgi:nucleoside-diphosphate-sugar epimerase
VRALITGDAGCDGRHMRAELEQRGWDVVGCDLKTGGDARELFLGEGSVYDLTVHCAYHVGGRAAIDGNSSLLALNLELDAQLFEWAVRTKQRHVLYFSSSAAYPIALQQADRHELLTEDDINLDDVWQPDARYGWAKLTGEQLARAAAVEGLAVHVVRPFSGYGEDQDADQYPFPAIVKRVLSGDLSVWGPPGQCRDWIHIDDVIAGALAVVDADERRPVNLCTGITTEFGGLALRINQLAGRPHAGPPRYEPDRPTGVMHRVGHPGRMLHLHRPLVDLDEGIRRAIRALS